MSRVGGYAEREPGSLKEAEDALVTACGGIGKAAALTRVRASQMHRYTAPGEADSHMPADVVMALELHCGIPHVTRFLAFESGALLVPVERGSHAEVSSHLAALGRDTGKLYGEACEGLKDGRLSPREAARVEREAMKSVAALSALIADLRALRKPAGGA